MFPITAKCFNNHMGLWLIDPLFFNKAFDAIKSGLMPALKKAEAPLIPVSASSFEGPNGQENRMYSISNGIALIDMYGPMMKGESKWGDTCSTVSTRLQLRQISRDPDVRAVMLIIDSPGGTVAGTDDLGKEVASLNNTKPVYAHVDDQCASAALWVASQCANISANQTAMVGSIGTLSIVHDTSKKMELEGTKVFVVSTGDLKGAFAEGTQVTPDMVDYLKGIVNDTNEFFLKAVATGRKMDIRNVRKAATGEMFMADKAKDIGLIDSIRSADDTLAVMTQKYAPKKMATKAEVSDLDLRLRIHKIFK